MATRNQAPHRQTREAGEIHWQPHLYGGFSYWDGRKIEDGFFAGNWVLPMGAGVGIDVFYGVLRVTAGIGLVPVYYIVPVHENGTPSSSPARLEWLSVDPEWLPLPTIDLSIRFGF